MEVFYYIIQICELEFLELISFVDIIQLELVRYAALKLLACCLDIEH